MQYSKVVRLLSHNRKVSSIATNPSYITTYHKGKWVSAKIGRLFVWELADSRDPMSNDLINDYMAGLLRSRSIETQLWSVEIKDRLPYILDLVPDGFYSSMWHDFWYNYRDYQLNHRYANGTRASRPHMIPIPPNTALVGQVKLVTLLKESRL